MHFSPLHLVWLSVILHRLMRQEFFGYVQPMVRIITRQYWLKRGSFPERTNLDLCQVLDVLLAQNSLVLQGV